VEPTEVNDLRKSSPLSVFVVDDNEDAAVMLSELLRTFGHRVHTFFDGQSALDVAGELRPRAAVLDIGMPRMHGYELAKRLREISPHTVLIACTGWGAAHDRARAKASGFDHHLVKPVGIDELRNVLNGVDPAEGCC
jgi:CheY-like chemotaxis protein